MTPKSTSQRKTRRTADIATPRSLDSTAVPPPLPRGSRPGPKVVRWRAPWHRVVGGCELAVGLVLVVLYYGEGYGYHLLPLFAPIWYAAAGITFMSYATVWFGWWDRPQ